MSDDNAPVKKKRTIARDSDESEDEPMSKRLKEDVAPIPPIPVNSDQVEALTDGEPLSVTTAISMEVDQHQQNDISHAQLNGIPHISSEDDAPLSALPNANGTNGHAPVPTKAADEEMSELEDVKPKKISKGKLPPGAPREKKTKQIKAETKKRKKKSGTSEDEAESSASDDLPLASTSKAANKKPRKSVAKAKAKPKAKRNGSDDDEEGDSDSLSVKKRASEAKSSAKAKGKGKAKDTEEAGSAAENTPNLSENDEDGEAEGDYKWWQAKDNDGTVKWETFHHQGVLFPPPYEPLPANVKLIYDGKPVNLPPEAEEVAGFYATMKHTDHAAKPVFIENFFKDFLSVLEEHPPLDGTVIESFELCDWDPMWQHFESERLRRKGMTKDQKKKAKDERDALEESYKTCLLDGRQEKVGNFRVEPPGLFRGRGAHPKTGKLKTRVSPSQVTLNLSADAPIPQAPDGQQWKAVQHDNTVSWLAFWKENINGAFKYVFLAAGSSLKGQSDLKKFEKARELKKHIDRIRKDYQKDLSDKQMVVRQRAVAIYLIDRFALRAGNEKGDDEADTVGCCSLKCNNITLMPENNEVEFDFLGKDSIRFLNKFQVDAQVFKNLRIFKKEPKADEDLLFDRLTTTQLNAHLKEYMVGLSAKVFRTYNASWVFQQELDKRTKASDSVADKLLAYNRANRDVAVLCNHQRSVGKGHEAAMGKMSDKILGIKYQRLRLQRALQAMNAPKSKGKQKGKGKNKQKKEEDSDDEHKAVKEEDDDLIISDDEELTEEWIEAHETSLLEAAKAKAQARFDKRVKEEAEKPDEASDDDDDEDDKKKKKKKPKKKTPQEELDAAVEKAEAAWAVYEKERDKNVYEFDKRGGYEQCVKDIRKLDDRIKAAETQRTDREEGKEIALGTSKLNYIDPRITFAWVKKYDVPIDRIFAKTLQEKFTWAADTPADFRW